MDKRRRLIMVVTAIIIILVALVAIMAIGRICPPPGPWPTPPWCESGTVGMGSPATVTFWVSVPATTPEGDVILVIDDTLSPIHMTRAGYASWTAQVPVKGGETVKYRYKSAGGESVGMYSITVTKTDQRVNDGVWGWTQSTFKPEFPRDFVVGIYMSDTWGRNYNFQMFEDTRKNIDSAFSRVARIGVREVYVHDFHRAVFDDKNADWATDIRYHFEGDVFENDMRDEVMTQEDLNRLAAIAHANGLNISWRTSVHFTDMTKYVIAGASGRIGEEVVSDWDRWSKTPRTSEWTRDFMAKYRVLLLERAEMLNKAGFDEMIITPGWHNPNFHPVEKEANEDWKQTIKDVKSVFRGRVGVVLDNYGFVDGNNGDEDWKQYDFYTTADDCYLYLYFLPESYAPPKGADFFSYKMAIGKYLDTIEAQAVKKDIRVSLIPGFFSYPDAVGANQFDIDIYDINNPRVKATPPDWQHQADAFEALFQASEGRERIVRIIPNGFWWDDAMDPGVPAKLSIGVTFRNKPSEGVINKWAQAVRAEK